MAKEPKIKLPVAFTTSQYSKKEGKLIPIGVLIVAETGVRGYGLKSNHASRHIGIIGSQFTDASKDDLTAFAQRYHDNAMNSSHTSVSISVSPYKGSDKKDIDTLLTSIMNQNADAILNEQKRSKS